MSESQTSAMGATVVWGASPSQRARISSPEELDSVIDELERQVERPFILEVVVPGVGSLSAGVGRDETVLSYVPESQDPPYLNSVGPTEDGDDLVFDYYGHWTDFRRRQAIPARLGRDALRRFLAHGTVPDIIQWEET